MFSGALFGHSAAHIYNRFGPERPTQVEPVKPVAIDDVEDAVETPRKSVEGNRSESSDLEMRIARSASANITGDIDKSLFRQGTA